MPDAPNDPWRAIYTLCLETLRARGWDVSRIAPDEAEVVALWRLEADGYNGGFLQFFCNWGEANCQTALRALARIGAADTLAVVAAQRRVLDRLENHPDLKELDDIHRLLTDDEDRLVSETLDHRFWAVAGEIDARGAVAYAHLLGSPRD